MTKENNNNSLSQGNKDELEALKSQANLMGIKFHPASGAQSLRDKIDAALVLQPDEVPAAPKLVAVESEGATRQRIKLEATALVRVRIACMNPNKKDWEGEIFCVGNSVIPTIKKMVPFNQDYHVPRMMLDMIRDRQCQIFTTAIDPVTRRKSVVGKLITEFAIEVLPDLTKEELKDLAQRQAMAEGTGTAA